MENLETVQESNGIDLQATTEDKKERAPRTTTYYGFNGEEQLITFQGTREEAKAWSKDHLLTAGTTTMAFFRQRQKWCVLLTGEGAGEHAVEDDGVPEAVNASFVATGGKVKAPGKRGPRSKVKFKASTKLERHVLKWGKEHAEGVVEAFKKVNDGHISTGYVEHLQTPEQTLKFYKKYRIEINMLLTDAVRAELIGGASDLEGWDSTDPLAQRATNQNILAWFGFELSVRNMMTSAGLEVA